MGVLSETLRVIDTRLTKLSNVTCAYCGERLTSESRTRDHVIGRRFVPVGSFDEGWNLIVRACRDCNGYKAALEDSLSALSMYSRVGVIVDDTLDREAMRKARGSRHPRTGKPVDESHHELKLLFPLYGGATATISLKAPPQPDQAALFDLAKLHCIAFMYWLTYDDRTREGRFGTGVFAPIGYALRSDWGNARLRAFMEAVVGWEPRALGDCANGYFRVAIRKHPEAACWSWAMEWNKNVRVAGFMGDERIAQELGDALPRPKATVIQRSGNDYKALRREQALAEADDAMFRWLTSGSEHEPSWQP